ncbi:hypothetical protein GCM10010172_67360 [Paractinoplanes ferrugineus]|uniref:Uncharacterized protein n=1 Tax=Paractinoplanes ferrugineus TaxID=113564 RepID=A0A919J370_9ACTN|nr:hypothetical protein [Actinoplanes ferrugineus]GIE13103.1 hypothetical protein Afe05nite_49430 [Actinoplanes ferrugineus]
MRKFARIVRPGLAGIAASLVVALPLAVASPAQAATKCGAKKTVRVSIQYQACDSNNSSGHRVDGFAKVQNNHGSSVKIKFDDGFTVNGGSIQWSPNTPASVTVPAGASQVSDVLGFAYCHSGDSIGFVFRVWNNDTDSWGATSYATPVPCP